jgi:hypothetical protein
MVRQGVLRECLLDPDVKFVQTVGRTVTGVQNRKLREIVRQDLLHYEAIESDLSGLDACFFCLGVSSSGMKEADYSRVTYEITMAAAEVLCRLNPQMTFIFVSGAGTDSSERGPSMWARIKGKTENALMRLPFAAAYMFRPGIIEPVHGARSKTPVYRFIYSIVRPLVPLLRRAFPNYVLSTQEIGLAMLSIARHGYSKRILETQDIRAVVGAVVE